MGKINGVTADIVHRASNPTTKREAFIRHNREWGEYIVQHFEDGKYLHKADYYTPDWDDAHDTANHWLRETL